MVQAAGQARSLPALDELGYRIDKHIAQIERSLNSGDEVGIIAFLRAHVESLFDYLGEFGREVRARIEAYRSALDARLGTVYRQRRLFEDSVTRIAEAISSHLDREEQAAQEMFPHYFEKQKTDGVDYQMYVGAEPAGGRPIRPHLPEEPAPVAAHAHVRDRGPRPSAPRSACRCRSRRRT